MCGITGFVDYQNLLSLSYLKEAVNLLRHRGPDSSGTYFKSTESFGVGLGHSRLAIIDNTEAGNQPFKSDCGNFIIVFNGTIYNYLELKCELISLGICFRSNSDTEVLLKSYIQWPDKFSDKIDGIYAAAIFDLKHEQFHLFRDKIGVKPLFYYHSNSHFLFASELRVFLKQTFFEKKISMEALGLYLQYAFFPQQHSILKNVFKVLPGEYLTLDLRSNRLTKYKLRNRENEPGSHTYSLTSIVETARLQIEKSVESRLVADAPVGVLLSGGYDSSLVAAIAQRKVSKPIKTFTVGFEEAFYNEAPFARKIASYLGTEHKELYFNRQLAIDLIQSIGKTFDEPMGDSGAVPLQLAAKLAARDVKVLLSAEGGDELFGGYPTYFKALQISKLSKLLPLSSFKFQNRYLNILTQSNALNTYQALSQYFTKAEAKQLCNFDASLRFLPNSSPDLNVLLAYDLNNYLPDDLLIKADRCTMASSIENRDPLLSAELVELVSKIPADIKCPGGKPKHLLKQIAHHYLPEELLNRPKKGFSMPVGLWMNGFLEGFTKEKINNLAKRGILNPDLINSTYIKFNRRPDKYYSRQVWILLALELWMEEWMD